MAKKKNSSVGSQTGIKNGKFKEDYAIGTPLKNIYSLDTSMSEQAQLMAMQPLKDRMNQIRDANFKGYWTDYPKGTPVPSLQYTPAVLADMKKRGLTKEYIESWQPANYRKGGPVEEDPKLPKGYKGITTEGTPYGTVDFPFRKLLIKDPRVSGLAPVGKEAHAANKIELANTIEKKDPEKASRLRKEAEGIYDQLSTRPKIGDKYVDVDAISYQDGGSVSVDELTTPERGIGIEGLAGMGADAISDMLMSIVGQRNKTLSEEIAEYRTNPADAMKKQAKGSIAADIATSTVKGATAGAVGGPLTAAIGAATGLVTSGAKALFGKKGREEDRAEASGDWSSFWGGRSVNALNEAGYAEGGKIKGKGTGKSDSIRMKAPEDAFIVPEENSAAAMQYGKDYLGWKDKEVSGRNYGNIDINVSNGEVFYTPEEYDLLSYYGVDVDSLAPNAEENKTGFCRGGKTRFQTGGPVEENDPNFVGPPGFDYDSLKVKDPEEKESALEKIMKSVGTVAGAAQVAGGTAGLVKAGQRPDVNVSNTLKSLSRTAREAAGYGLPPAAKNELKKQSARKMRQAFNAIAGQGGSAQDIYKKQIGALATGLAETGKTELYDYEAREKKIDRSVGIDLKLVGQEFDVNKIGLASWEKDQDLWANLLSVGIENIIGANQYNKELEVIKEIQASRKTNFTIPA